MGGIFPGPFCFTCHKRLSTSFQWISQRVCIVSHGKIFTHWAVLYLFVPRIIYFHPVSKTSLIPCPQSQTANFPIRTKLGHGSLRFLPSILLEIKTSVAFLHFLLFTAQTKAKRYVWGLYVCSYSLHPLTSQLSVYSFVCSINCDKH